VRKAWWRSLVVFVGSSVCLAAGAPVAVRVEVQPLRAADDETLVAVVVQVAPEDRARIGSNAMVRLELDGGTPDGISPLWAVKVAGDGTARIEVPWPPGEHDLRVEIMNPSGQDSGLWVGRVRIPRMPAGGGTTLKGPPGKETPVDQPSPTEARAQAPPPATPGITAAGQAEAVATPPPAMPEPSPAPRPEPAETATVSGSPPAEAPPEPTVAETVRSPSPSPEPTEIPKPTAQLTEAAPPAAPPPLPTPTRPVVEPLRGQAPSPTPLPVVEPLRGAAPPPPPAATEPAAPPAVDRAALEAWASAESGTRDLTVVVTRAGDPVQDLTAADLELEADGKPVTIDSIGDSRSAPLMLGVAVDLSAGRAGEFETIRKYLAPLTARANDGRGRLFATATGSGEVIEGASPLEKALRTGGAGNLAQLIASSLPPFSGQRARTFLLVLTDGRGPEPTKEEWKQANDAAAAAGVPILVVALWDSDFPQRVRKNLQQIAGDSGGQLFLVQGLDQMGSAVDRYGRALDAGVALRFRPPPAAKAGLLKIDVQATKEGIEVRSAKTIGPSN